MLWLQDQLKGSSTVRGVSRIFEEGMGGSAQKSVLKIKMI